MTTVSYSLKNYFFDRAKVIDRLGKAKTMWLRKAGATLRLEARRTQLRRRKRTSAAGSPPSIHSTDSVATLRNILFGFDGVDRVIVGPVGLNGRSVINGQRTAGGIPGLHEFGGTLRIRETLDGNMWKPSNMVNTHPGQPTRWRDANYPARPFMGPALKAVAKRLPLLFFRTVKE